MKERNTGRWFLAGIVAVILLGLTTDQIMNNVYDSTNTALRSTIVNASGTPVSFSTPTPLAFGTPGVLAAFAATELGAYPGSSCTPPALALSTSASGVWTCATPVPSGGTQAGILIGTTLNTVSTSTVSFFSINGLTTSSTSNSGFAVRSAAGVKYSNLDCAATTAAPGGSASYAIALRLANTDSALTCTMTGAAASCTDGTHTITTSDDTFTNGQLVYTSTPASSPTATALSCSMKVSYP